MGLIKMKLELMEEVRDGLPKGFVPYTLYSMIVNGEEVGRLTLRHGSDDECYYDGHIGYTVFEEYRGHHYSYEGCLLLKEIVDCDHLIVTCDPKNSTSQKIIQRLGCEYIETRTIPKNMKKFFASDEFEKEIYIWKIR